jgi:flagellar secretion chaperone FliS
MMNHSESLAVGEYQHIKTRYDVESATPHRLIQLMMERVLAKISMARGHMQQQDVANKGRLIGDAIEIIGGLQESLNYKANEKLSGNFDALYDYMTRRLLEANLKNNEDILFEVAGLMGELKEAWDAISGEANSTQHGTSAS